MRHKLQEGLLSKRQLPKSEDMGELSSYLKMLERLENPSIKAILAVKIPKLLKKIGRLAEIPSDDEFHFKERAMSLYGKWKITLEKEEQHNLSPGKIEPVAIRQPATSPAVKKPLKGNSESLDGDLTETCQSAVAIRSQSSGTPTSDQSTAVLIDEGTSQPEVVDLTDESQPDVLMALGFSGQASSRPTNRKRKRTGATSCDRVQASDAQTHLKQTPTNISTRTRRRRVQKTSPEKHLSDEISWMNQSVKLIQVIIQKNNEEIDAIRIKRARLLEELEHEMELAVRQRDRLMGVTEHLLAWGAQDEKVTGEWEHSR